MAAPDLMPARPGCRAAALGDGDVHLWWAWLHEDPAFKSSPELLSPAERLQASRFRFDRDRRRYTQARVALRRLLGAYCGLAPEALTLKAQAQGKPWLVQDRGLHFNLSHAGDALLIGLTRRAPIGVDVEQVRSLPGAPGIARTCFSAAEQRYLANCPQGGQDAAFFRTWTAKEAALKALGTGFSAPPQCFSALPAPGADGRVRLSGLAGDWTLRWLNPQPGCQAAMAVRADPVRTWMGWLDLGAD